MYNCAVYNYAMYKYAVYNYAVYNYAMYKYAVYKYAVYKGVTVVMQCTTHRGDTVYKHHECTKRVGEMRPLGYATVHYIYKYSGLWHSR